jgi:stage II sporulation protein M
MGLLKENRMYLLAASLLMIFGMWAGALIPQTGGPISDNPFLKSIEQYVQFYKPYDVLTVLFLFSKNTLTASLAFLLAPVLLVVPAGILLLNGFMVGMVGSALTNHASLVVAVAALAPHGIFELPALVFACAGGLRFGLAAFRKAISVWEHKPYSLSREFMWAWRLFIISTMMLLAAAIMETYVTPFVVGYFS